MPERDDTAGEHPLDVSDATGTDPVQTADATTGPEDDAAAAPAEGAPPVPPTPPLPPLPPLPGPAAPPRSDASWPSAAPGSVEAPAANAAAGIPGSVGTPAAGRSTPTWLTGGAIGSSVLAGAIALGFAVVASVVVILLTLVFALVAGAPSTGATGGSSIDFSSLQIGGVPFVGPVIWLATLGLFGQLSAGLSVTVLGTTGSFQGFASFVPAIVLVTAVAGGVWWSYRAEVRARTTSRAGLWALAGLSGLAAGIIAILLALAGRTTVIAGGGLGSTAFEVSTVTFGTFFGPLVTTGIAAVIGRWLARGTSARQFGQAVWHAPSRFRWGFRDVYDYLVVLALVFVPASLVLVFIAGNGAATAWPAGVGLLTVLAAAVGHLGAYSVAGSVPGAASGAATLSLFSQDTSPLAWLLVLFAILAVFVAAILIARRRAADPVPPAQLWRVPVLTVAAALAIGLTIGGGYAFGSANMVVANANVSVVLTPAVWTYALVLIWAAAVEAVARWVAPPLLATWPALRRWRIAGDGIGVAGASAPGTPAGARVSGAGPMVPEPSAAAAPLSPRGRRALVIGGIVAGALVVIAIVGGVVVSTLQNTVFSPKTVVEGYVEDIVAGRFASASADAGVDSGEGTDLLDAEQVDLTEPITGVAIGDPTGVGDSRSVPVTFTLSGEPQSASVTLVSTGKQFLIFDTWAISTGLETEVQVFASGVEDVSVGGVLIPVAESPSVLAAYPGVYPVEGPESAWVTVATEPLTVSSYGGALNVEGVPSQALIDEVQRQVDAALDVCAESEQTDPDGCPFSLFAFGDTRNVSWSITEYPTVELSGIDAFYGSGGEASATYERSFFGDEWSAEADSVSILLSGDIAIEGDTATVTLNSY